MIIIILFYARHSFCLQKIVLSIYNDYRMLCPALPAGRCKKCVNVSKYSSFFVPPGTLYR